MLIRYPAIAVLSTVALATLNPIVALAAPKAADAFTTVTRDGVPIRYQRVAAKVTVPAPGAGAASADFDGDGADDVAAASVGGVIVHYSSAPWRDYLAAPRGGTVTLGESLATGDFDGDGYDDLVVSSPDEVDPKTKKSAGGLWIVPGSSAGLKIDGIRHLNQSSAGVPGTSAAEDRFAADLAVGDLDADGDDDLAVGVPGKTVRSARAAGEVLVLLGGPSGISTTAVVRLDQSHASIPGTPEAGDSFGARLAIGQFNQDDYADLVIGTPWENDTVPTTGVGMINVVPGGVNGVDVRDVSSLTAASINKLKRGVSTGQVGSAIVLADVDGAGRKEIVLGDGQASVGRRDEAGAVYAVSAGKTGVLTDRLTIITQDTVGVPGNAETYDGFGTAVAAGDVTGDGYADVLVGTPGEDIGVRSQAGAATLLRGTAKGLTGTGAQAVDRTSAGSPHKPRDFEWFGSEVAVLNLDRVAGFDALVGAPGDDPMSNSDFAYGTVTQYAGSARGLSKPSLTSGRALQIAGMDISAYGVTLVSP
ncbi:MAG TPA: FG-GAP repeat protein [Actinoplanes sp.]|nr:FG-GAP repeat protein [Actinoplanes sp.]